jgi:hypothetical protein
MSGSFLDHLYLPNFSAPLRQTAPPLRQAFWRSQSAETIGFIAAAPLFIDFQRSCLISWFSRIRAL